MRVCKLFAPVLLVASVASATLAQAQAFPPPPPLPPMSQHCPDCKEGLDGGPWRGPAMPIPGVQLSEAQQDKLFALHHAAAPARRARQKELRRAHEALRAMGESGRFDEARAVALAQSLGQAIAAEELDHAREQAQFLALLTPEQRATMQKSDATKPDPRAPAPHR